jgi:hypothetical protein
MPVYVKDAHKPTGFQSHKAGPTVRVRDGARVGYKGRCDAVSNGRIKGQNALLNMLDGIAAQRNPIGFTVRIRKKGERFEDV